jgi:hypothetical protein
MQPFHRDAACGRFPGAEVPEAPEHIAGLVQVDRVPLAGKALKLQLQVRDRPWIEELA